MFRTYRKEAAQEQSYSVCTYNFQFKVVVGAGGVHSGNDSLGLGGDEAEAEKVRLCVQGEAAHWEVILDQTLDDKVTLFINLLLFIKIKLVPSMKVLHILLTCLTQPFQGS